MPNYYNPYNFYPVQYANQMGYGGMPMQQSNMMMPQQSQSVQPQMKAMEWVEGEVGAKAFQMPAGWPANQPIPLWDSTDTIIWLKSWGPMGIPNPMQKLTYVMPQQQSQYLISGNEQNGNASGADANQQDLSRFVTKDDLNELRDEIRQMQMNSNNRNNAQRNQNGSPGANNGGVNNGTVSGNRGGNG